VSAAILDGSSGRRRLLGPLGNPRIVYRPREDTTPQGEVSALCAVYKFVLAKQRAAHPAALDDVKESNGYVATKNLTR
jgi:hypothetical protein